MIYDVDPTIIHFIIQGFYNLVKSTGEFAMEQGEVRLKNFKTLPGKRDYLVVFGHHGSVESTTNVVLLKGMTSSGCSLTQCQGIAVPVASLTSFVTIIIMYGAL